MVENIARPTREELNNISSQINVPVGTLSMDTECLRINNEYCLAEISFYDVVSNKNVFSTYINPGIEFHVQEYKKYYGFDDDVIKNSPKLIDIEEVIKRLLSTNILIGWNIKEDLKYFPHLKAYAYAVRDCMTRYSNKYGAWNPGFGNNDFVSLEQASKNCGFKLAPGEKYHTARVDAKACAHVWQFCEDQDLPKPSIPNELVKKSDLAEVLKPNVDLHPLPF